MPKRTFHVVETSELESLQVKQYSKATEKGIKFARKLFDDFLATKQTVNLPTEVSLLDDLLAEFWPSLRKVDGDHFRASTVLTTRQYLRMSLIQNDVDILNTTLFRKSDAVFLNVQKQLKKSGHGFVRHHPDVHTSDMQKIVQTLDETNNTHLQWLTWIFVMLFYCRRGIENLTTMTKSDFETTTINGKRAIKFRNKMTTKNHNEIDEDYESGGVIPEVEGNRKSPYAIITSYMAKLHGNCERFWQLPRKNVCANDEVWYCNQPVGINTLSKMMSSICEFCAINKYTNHSLRATSCTVLGTLGYTDIEVQSVSKHKTISSLAIYKRVKPDKKATMATALANAIGIETPNSILPLSTADVVPLASNDLPEITCEEIEQLLSAPNQVTNIQAIPVQSNASSSSYAFQPVFNNCNGNITINFNQ